MINMLSLKQGLTDRICTTINKSFSMYRYSVPIYFIGSDVWIFTITNVIIYQIICKIQVNIIKYGIG